MLISTGQLIPTTIQDETTSYGAVSALKTDKQAAQRILLWCFVCLLVFPFVGYAVGRCVPLRQSTHSSQPEEPRFEASSVDGFEIKPGNTSGLLLFNAPAANGESGDFIKLRSLLGRSFDIVAITSEMDFLTSTLQTVFVPPESTSDVNCYTNNGFNHCYGDGVMLQVIDTLHCSRQVSVTTTSSQIATIIGSSIGIESVYSADSQLEFESSFQAQEAYGIAECKYFLYSVSLQHTTNTDEFNAAFQYSVSNFINKYGTHAITGFSVGVGFRIGMSISMCEATTSIQEKLTDLFDKLSVTELSSHDKGFVTNFDVRTFGGFKESFSGTNPSCLVTSNEDVQGCFIQTAIENAKYHPSIVKVNPRLLSAFSGSIDSSDLQQSVKEHIQKSQYKIPQLSCTQTKPRGALEWIIFPFGKLFLFIIDIVFTVVATAVALLLGLVAGVLWVLKTVIFIVCWLIYYCALWVYFGVANGGNWLFRGIGHVVSVVFQFLGWLGQWTVDFLERLADEIGRLLAKPMWTLEWTNPFGKLSVLLFETLFSFVLGVLEIILGLVATVFWALKTVIFVVCWLIYFSVLWVYFGVTYALNWLLVWVGHILSVVFQFLGRLTQWTIVFLVSLADELFVLIPSWWSYMYYW